MSEPDDLDRLLAPTSREPSFTFRARLRDRTTRHLQRRLALQRLAHTSALAASFIVGGVVVWLAKPLPEPEVVIVEKIVEKSRPPEMPQLPRSPHQLELAA